MKHRRISNSPLLDPAACVLVLIAPDPLDPSSIDPSVRTGHQRTVSALSKAADIANVPVLVLTRHALEQQKTADREGAGHIGASAVRFRRKRLSLVA